MVVKIGVLASGRGSNFQALIDAVESSHVRDASIVVLIVDKKDAYAQERARKHGIDSVFIDPSSHASRDDFDREIVRELRERGVELVLLAGYMRIVSSYFVREFKNRVINIHPALLPSFPGLHGQRDALEYGVKVTGCTVHFVDDEVDHGPIIIQKVVEVREGDDEASLAARILEQEHKAYPEAVKLFVEGKLRIDGRRVRVLK
ncbi:MAG: phosphoribosylglycinamide formyltransferase [Candidatus Altiarchaeota archaeon]